MEKKVFFILFAVFVIGCASVEKRGALGECITDD
jgi:hypothetical protein